MKIFLSWSGPLSREVAALFSRYLSLASSSFDVWFDLQSIHTGMRWDSQIREALDRCDMVLIFVTDANSPWMLFEAGVAHSLGKRIVPITIGISPSQLSGPLAQFQAIDTSSYGAINSFIEWLVQMGGIPETEQLLAQQRWERLFPLFTSDLNRVLKKEESERLFRDMDKARATDAFDKAWTRKND